MPPKVAHASRMQGSVPVRLSLYIIYFVCNERRRTTLTKTYKAFIICDAFEALIMVMPDASLTGRESLLIRGSHLDRRKPGCSLRQGCCGPQARSDEQDSASTSRRREGEAQRVPGSEGSEARQLDPLESA